MQQEIEKLKRQAEDFQNRLNDLERAMSIPLKGSLDDLQTERVLNTDTSGTPATNTLLRDVAISVSVPYSIALSGDPETISGTLTGTGTITVLDYPKRLKIDTWKGQRLVIPVYDADKIIYP